METNDRVQSIVFGKVNSYRPYSKHSDDRMYGMNIIDDHQQSIIIAI